MSDIPATASALLAALAASDTAPEAREGPQEAPGAGEVEGAAPDSALYEPPPTTPEAASAYQRAAERYLAERRVREQVRAWQRERADATLQARLLAPAPALVPETPRRPWWAPWLALAVLTTLLGAMVYRSGLTVDVGLLVTCVGLLVAMGVVVWGVSE